MTAAAAQTPLTVHPRKRKFTAQELRLFYQVTPIQFQRAVDEKLIADRDHRRDELTDDVLAGFELAAELVLLDTAEVAKLLGVTSSTVRATVTRRQMEPAVIESHTRTGSRRETHFWSQEQIDALLAEWRRRFPDFTPHTTAAEIAAARDDAVRDAQLEQRSERERAAAARQQHLDEHVPVLDRLARDVTVTTRQLRGPAAVRGVHMHLGPTNSGKTHHALAALVEAYRADPDGVYIYAGPLRMLAQEVHARLAEQVGPAAVGVLTGEEQTSPDAPILCCTAEMAPRSGDVLVIDEAHWAADDQRGRHWTDLLTASDFRDTVVAGPSECEDLLRAAYADLPDAAVRVTHHERKIPLTFIGAVRGGFAPRTAIVAFSRRRVTDIVTHLHDRGVRALPLYGALPLSVRRAHIAEFVEGRVDVLVTTDVIGHGINLPIDRVVFSETSKFDGTRIRSLLDWEAAQIAGRAGRFGLSDAGEVGFWHFAGTTHQRSGRNDPDLLMQAVDIASGESSSRLRDTARLTVVPSLDSLALGSDEQQYMAAAVRIWIRRARELYHRSDLITVSSMHIVHDNLHAIAMRLRAGMVDRAGDDLLGAKPWSASVEDLWALANGPFTEQDIALGAGARWISDHDPAALARSYRRARRGLGADAGDPGKQALEHMARQITGFRSLGRILDADGAGDLPCGITAEQMEQDEREVAVSLTEVFADELSRVRPAPGEAA
ncbi:helicase-related protein [Mycolicibacterium conceptionense]|uniref:helicase-related protein n=1 Tax=Mycolicibacterium conceptionense TaxID=451644 RepID=UPI000662BE0B|nr:helicase-related protein [Mycolicibacterium conceptionense]